MKIWYLITEETRLKLRKLLPKGWKPPDEEGRAIIVPLEDTEKIAKIMSQAPESRRSLGA